MPILLDHLKDIDELKEKIEEESEEILKVINLKHFLTLKNEEQVNYLKDILFDNDEIINYYVYIINYLRE